MNSTISRDLAMSSFDSNIFDAIELEYDQQFNPLDNMYISIGEVVERPLMALAASADLMPADGSTVFLIGGVPQGTLVKVLGPITDGWVELSGEVAITVNIPGSYTVLLTCFPYQDAEVKFDAA